MAGCYTGNLSAFWLNNATLSILFERIFRFECLKILLLVYTGCRLSFYEVIRDHGFGKNPDGTFPFWCVALIETKFLSYTHK